LVAVRDTVYVPVAVYVCEGFFSTDVPPSPKVHDHDEGELADASTNVMVSGALPDVWVALKAAMGSRSAADTGRENSRMIKIASILVDAVIFFMIPPRINCFF
jgi:hypothetical protein